MGQTTLKYRQIAGGLDGWIPAGETWAYASATTITVPSGAASKYQKGDKVKITNNSATKYFCITGVADTVLTVMGGSDYTVHNSAITNPYFSKTDNPLGFPVAFTTATPTWTTDGTAFTNQPTSVTCKFKMLGELKILSITAQCHATSGGTGSFIATFAAGAIPSAVNYLMCSSTNLSTATPGYAKIAGLAAYCAAAGGNTLATNSQWFMISIIYY